MHLDHTKAKRPIGTTPRCITAQTVPPPFSSLYYIYIPSATDFSAGTKEDWRPDADDFPAEALGEPLGDWEGEVWADVNNEVHTRVIGYNMPLLLRSGFTSSPCVVHIPFRDFRGSSKNRENTHTLMHL